MKKIVLSLLLVTGVTLRADWPDVSGWLSASQRAAAIAKEVPDSVKEVLDKIFKKVSVAFTMEELERLGFKILSWGYERPFFGNDVWLGEIAVIEHPDLPGYLFKIPKPDAHATSIARNLTRIYISEKIRDIIAHNNLNIDVPEKWSYLVKGVPVVIAQKLEIQPVSCLSELGTKTYNDILWVAHKLGLWDVHRGNVIPVKGMDRVSYIDTEKFDPAALPMLHKVLGNDVMSNLVLAQSYKNKQYPWYHWRRYQYADSIADFKPLLYGAGAITAVGLYAVLVQHAAESHSIDNAMCKIIDSLEHVACGANTLLSDDEMQLICRQAFRENGLSADVIDAAFIDGTKQLYALNERIQNLRNSIKRVEIIIDDVLFHAGGRFSLDRNYGPAKRFQYVTSWFWKNTSEADRNKDLLATASQMSGPEADEFCKVFAEYIALCRTLDVVKKDQKAMLVALKDKVIAKLSWYCRMKNRVKSALGY